ncbi:hypothetical protein MC885_018679 [Smutsia gigantea]|nr:hypothetical protein MC885_018679 [Smutsia gigantea]
MEFEAEEAKQMQTAQWMTAAQGLPPPVYPRPGPWAPQPQNRARSKVHHHVPQEPKARCSGSLGRPWSPKQPFSSQGHWALTLMATSSLESPLTPTGEWAMRPSVPSRTLVPVDQVALTPMGMSPSSALPQRAQCWGGAAGPPTLLPCTLSARIRRKAGAGAQPASAQPHLCQQGPHAEAPTEIPPEAVGEYTGTREWLLGPCCPVEGAPGREGGEAGSELPQGEEGAYPDPGLLSYIDELCAQEDFITKVWAVLHPRFLADVLSPEPQLDLCALAEELEQEGLSLAQLQQKRLLALEQEEGVQAPPSHGTPNRTQGLLRQRPARIPRGTATAPSEGTATKPAHQSLVACSTRCTA